MQKKLRARLEVGRPIYFVDSAKSKPDLSKSIELLEFACGMDRFVWTVKAGNGEILSGGIRDSKELPFIPNGYMCLAVPIKLHIRGNNRLAPDFIFGMPGSYLIVPKLAAIR